MIDGIKIENRVMKNSYRGTLHTDAGSFSYRTAEKLGKKHGLCVYHEMASISVATTGSCPGVAGHKGMH